MLGNTLGKARAAAQSKTEGTPFIARLKKLGRKKLIAIAAAIVVVLAIIVGFILQANAQNAASSTITVTSATVEKGNVATTIDSSGTISNTGVSEVEMPSSLEVTEVLVSAGDTVEKGDKLAKVDKSSAAEALVDINETIDDLEDAIDDLEAEDDATTEGSDTYYELVSYNAKLDTLNTLKKRTQKIYDSGYITATADGIIDSISDTSSSSSDTSSTTQSVTTPASYTNSATASTDDSTSNSNALSTGTVQTASYTINTTGTTSNAVAKASTTGTSAKANDTSTASSAAKANATNVIHLASSDSDSQSSSGSSDDESSDSGDSDSATDTQIIADSYVTSHLQVTAPVTGNTPQASIDSTDAYTGSISWNNGSGAFAANTSYAAQIVLTAKDGYAFSSANDYTINIAGATVNVSIKGGSNTAGNKLCITAVFQSTNGSSSSSSSANQQGNGQSGSAAGGIKLSGNSGGATSGGTVTGTVTGGTSDTTSATSDSAAEYSVETTDFAGIASSDKAVITLSIDELDIGSVEKDQNATVTLDAFEGQEFSGSVSKVSASSTSGKYTVEVTLDREDGMLSGMSASAVINIAESNDVLVVPTSALVEQNGSYFVYTSTDDNGNPSGQTQVEVGLSDGTQTEITSGLSEGDTVYYTKLDSTGSDSMQFDMGNMGEMPSGEMPGGGQGGQGGDMQPPSGDGQGGGQGGPGGEQGAN